MTRDFLSVAGAVLRRNLIHAFTNPALLVPSAVFPLLFLVAFAGGLSSVGNVPGLRLPIRLHGLPVRLRLPAVGGLRRGVHRLRGRRATSSRASAGACCWPRRGGGGSSPGYALAAIARWFFTATIVSVAAAIAGMHVDGDLAQLVGAALARAAGEPHRDAVGRRHGAALPVAAGGARDADPRVPDPVHGPGLRAARPHQRAGSTTPRPTTPSPRCSKSGRGFISGAPDTVGLAYLAGVCLVALGLFWALTGLRRAERGL